MTAPNKTFAARARSLRAKATDAERALWYHLRDRRFHGLKFVRQLQIGPYIADFACRERDLVIELDGGQHGLPETIDYDARRTTVLSEHGYEVLRFWNTDVLENLDGVLQSIAERLAKAPSPGLRYAKSDLSPKGEVKEENCNHQDHLSLGGEVGQHAAAGWTGEEAFPSPSISKG